VRLCGFSVFFGLGTCIKFPSNFEESPYSIIATGSTTLPQRLRFPFSLVNLPGETIDGISPAFNEIFTGWVLSDSVFTVWRNQLKFAKRDKARRQRWVEHRPPQLLGLLAATLHALL